MDENEFLNAFMGVDILQVEGVAEVMGRAVAKFREGLLKAGITEEAANGIIGLAINALVVAVLAHGANENRREN